MRETVWLCVCAAAAAAAAAAAQAADRPSAWGWAVDEAEPLRLPPAALGLLSQVSMGWGRGTQCIVMLLKN